MKSINQFFFNLVLLLNANVLFAQVPIGLQVLSREQGTGYREQVINSREKASPLRNDTIPISNLPSSISNLGVIPKLMMNPLTVEEETNAAEKALEIFGGRTFSAERTVDGVQGTGVLSVRAVHSDLVSAVPSSSSSNQVLRLREGGAEKSQPVEGFKTTGNTNDEEGLDNEGINPIPPMTAAQKIAMKEIEEDKTLIEAAKSTAKIKELKTSLNSAVSAQKSFQAEAIAFAKTKATQAREKAAAGKAAAEVAFEKFNSPEGEAWNRVALKSEQASKSWDKVSETLTRGNQEVASLWRKAAEKENASAEECEQVLNKAAEASDQGKPEIVDLWTKGAEQMKSASEYNIKVLQARKLNNEDDVESCNNIAYLFWHSAMSFASAASALEKATIATVKGNAFVAELWSKTAVQFQETAEYYQKVVEVKLIRNKTEADCWHIIARSVESSAYWLKLAAEAFEKAATATVEGNASLAELWNKIATQKQEAAEYDKKASEAKLSGNNAEACRWRRVAKSIEIGVSSLDLAAEVLEKATAATVKGNTSLAELWNKLAVQHQETAEYYQKVTEAKLSRNKEKEDLWDQISFFAMTRSDCLYSAAEDFEKASTATAKGNQSLAEFWNQITAQHQEIAEYYQKVVEAKLSGNDVEADRWEKIAISKKESADALRKEAKKLAGK